MNEQHFAGSRLAYSVWSVRLWMKTWERHPHGLTISYVGRCVEKGAHYLIAVMDDMFEKLWAAAPDGTYDEDLAKVHTVMCINDCGPHYRCNRFMAQCCYLWPHKFRRHWAVSFLLEQHGKGRIDAHFGRFARRLSLTALDRNITTIAEVISAQWEHYNRTQKLGGREHEEYVEYLPAFERSSLNTVLLKPRSLMVPLRSSYFWTMSIVDRRRRSLLGHGGVVTGVEVRARLLPGQRGTATRTGFVAIAMEAAEKEEAAAADAEAEAEAEEKADDGKIKELGYAVAEHLGWRCSYRRHAPENMAEAEKVLRQRLRRKTPPSWRASWARCLQRGGTKTDSAAVVMGTLPQARRHDDRVALGLAPDSRGANRAPKRGAEWGTMVRNMVTARWSGGGVPWKVGDGGVRGAMEGRG